MDQTAFIRRCRDRRITRPELTTFIKQHYWYSRNFTRYLAALLSNLENEADSLALTHNLFDEMGFGEAGNIPHSLLYRNMAQRMELQFDQAPFTSTTSLADTMLACCRSPNVMVGLGALCVGAEGIVPHVYAAIVEGFLAVGEVRENLLFFTLHIDCDDDHAATMRKIIERELAERPDALDALSYGAETAIKARIRFFEGLPTA
ncbi:TenA family transcriptional regulator [Methylomagnum sp.]